VLAILRPFELALGWVGVESIIIFIGFLSLIAWTHRSSTPAVPTGETSHQELGQSGDSALKSGSMLRDLRPDLLRFGLAASVFLRSNVRPSVALCWTSNSATAVSPLSST